MPNKSRPGTVSTPLDLAQQAKQGTTAGLMRQNGGKLSEQLSQAELQASVQFERSSMFGAAKPAP